jgi:CO/xanthine dehydrogenase Mo-binding subunit
MRKESNPNRESVGHSIPRIDGRDKVSGRAQYVDDLPNADCLHGRTLRSTVAHGRLLAINLDPAFDWTAYTVVTAADIPGVNFVTLMEPDQPVLVPVGGVIKHQDEALALVAGPTKEGVAHALAHMTVDVDPLPALLDMDTALSAEQKIYGDNNIFKQFEITKGSNVEDIFNKAEIVVEGVYETGAQEQMYIETQGMWAHWCQDKDDVERMYVKGSMQCPYYIHTAIKPIFELPDDRVIVSQSVTGGGFGGKEEYPSMLAAHTCLLAYKAQKAVKIIYDRGEDIGATTKRHPARIHHRMALKSDGTIEAIDVDILLDGGAYLTLTPVVLSRAVLHAAGPYRCANTHIAGRAIATHTPPHGAYRGFGAPQVTFAYERQAQKAAQAVGMSPWEFRKKNCLLLGDTTATGQNLSMSVASEQVLDAVQAQVNQPAPKEARRLGDAPHIKRGGGLSFYYHGAGFTGSGEARMKAQVAVAVTDAGRFEVRSASTDIGQGVITIFTQMAATVLGVGVEDVSVATSQTDLVPNSGPTVASRTCMVVGSIVEKASHKLKEKLQEFAEAKGLASHDMSQLARAYAEKHGEFEALATYRPPPGIHFDDVSYTGDAYPVFGWAACWVEVAVDLDTYEVTLERCVHAVDVGKAIHPVIVKGQIEGGTLQSLGWALWENVIYQEGRVINRRMTDCIIPTFLDAPEMETLIVEEPYLHGPHGAKGVGEIPMDGPAAAVANAIDDALGPLLKQAPDRVPLLPETLSAMALGQQGGSWL